MYRQRDIVSPRVLLCLSCDLYPIRLLSNYSLFTPVTRPPGISNQPVGLGVSRLPHSLSSGDPSSSVSPTHLSWDSVSALPTSDLSSPREGRRLKDDRRKMVYGNGLRSIFGLPPPRDSTQTSSSRPLPPMSHPDRPVDV